MSKLSPVQKRLNLDSFKRVAESVVGQKNFGLLAFGCAVMFMFLSAWLPEGLSEYIEYLCSDVKSGTFNYKLSTSFVILAIVWFSFRKISSNAKSKITVQSTNPAKARQMALFLSPFRISEARNRNLQGALVYSDKNQIEKELLAGTFSESGLDGTTWEMPMKAITYHLPVLHTVSVFTSSGASGTSGEFDLLSRVIGYCHHEIAVSEQVLGGMDFENLEQVFDEVEKFYGHAKAMGLKEQESIVDITGAQKTNSIAGAMATLVTGRKFQYINKDKVVRAYDVGYFDDSAS